MNSVLAIMCFCIPCFGAELQETKEIEASSSAKATADELVQKSQAPIRSLLIFMDTSEKNWSAVSYDLINALEQKTSPILASKTLFKRIFFQNTVQEWFKSREDFAQDPNAFAFFIHDSAATKQFLSFFTSLQRDIKQFTMEQAGIRTIKDKNIHAQSFLKKINATPDDWNWKGLWEETYQARIRSLMSFDFNEWIIAETGANYLLIPRSLHASFKTFFPASSDSLTARELELGLKIDHLNIVTIEQLNKERQIDADKTSIDYSFFVTRAEYTDKKISLEKMPQWIVYIIGHGYSGKTIAGLTIEQFQELLTFFDTKVVTRFLLYKSCYSAGTNAAILFEDKKRIAKTFSFPIMFNAIPETQNYIIKVETGLPGTLTQDDINYQYGTLLIHTYPDFKRIIVLASQENIDYEAIAATLSAKLAQRDNAMLVKPAYLEWTTLLNAERFSFVISKNSALTRDEKKPLSIDQFVGTDDTSRAILLYAHYIPFELIIGDTKTIPAFVSMIPGDALHVMEKVTTSMPISSIMESLNPILSSSHKIFWIKTLITHVYSIHDFIIDLENENYGVLYYTFYNKHYQRIIKKSGGSALESEKEITNNYTEKYLKIMHDDRGYQNELIERKKISEIQRVQERKIQKGAS